MTTPPGLEDLIERAAAAIYDAPDSQSGDFVGTVIWNSEHLFYETVEGESIIDRARRASMPVCRDAARAALQSANVEGLVEALAGMITWAENNMRAHGVTSPQKAVGRAKAALAHTKDNSNG